MTISCRVSVSPLPFLGCVRWCGGCGGSSRRRAHGCVCAMWVPVPPALGHNMACLLWDLSAKWGQCLIYIQPFIMEVLSAILHECLMRGSARVLLLPWMPYGRGGGGAAHGGREGVSAFSLQHSPTFCLPILSLYSSSFLPSFIFFLDCLSPSSHSFFQFSMETWSVSELPLLSQFLWKKAYFFFIHLFSRHGMMSQPRYTLFILFTAKWPCTSLASSLGGSYLHCFVFSWSFVGIKIIYIKRKFHQCCLSWI